MGYGAPPRPEVSSLLCSCRKHTDRRAQEESRASPKKRVGPHPRRESGLTQTGLTASGFCVLMMMIAGELCDGARGDGGAVANAQQGDPTPHTLLRSFSAPSAHTFGSPFGDTFSLFSPLFPHPSPLTLSSLVLSRPLTRFHSLVSSHPFPLPRFLPLVHAGLGGGGHPAEQRAPRRLGQTVRT